jgi:Tol biopolymer transport system component
MNQQPDRLLVDWLTDGPEHGPRHGLDRALAATRRTNQRPGWTFASTWLPAPLAAHRAASQRSFALLLAVVLLVVALAATVLLVGSQRRPAPPFGLANNGTILADVDGRLWQADADGSDPRQFAGESLGLAYSPVFSPDGTRVSYLTQADERQPMSIFVANADGTGTRNVTGDMKIIAKGLDAPAWSPDGSRLVFMSSDSPSGTRRLYTVGADGSGLTAVHGDDANRQYASWSPDGQWLAYQLKPTDITGGTHLAISRPDGSDERRLVSVPLQNLAMLASPQWAPDSKRLAYFTTGQEVNLAQASGEGVVGVVGLDGTTTRLSLEGENAFNPLWSSDGRRLLYSYDGATVVDPDDPSSRIEIPAGLADCAAAWGPDATQVLGLGRDCKDLFLISLAEPGAATRVDFPTGDMWNASWQRISR